MNQNRRSRQTGMTGHDRPEYPTTTHGPAQQASNLTVTQALQQALAHHQAGRLQEAVDFNLKLSPPCAAPLISNTLIQSPGW